jgi:hypothetical protein
MYDGGGGPYEVSKFRNFAIDTPSHNTIMVDGTNFLILLTIIYFPSLYLLVFTRSTSAEGCAIAYRPNGKRQSKNSTAQFLLPFNTLFLTAFFCFVCFCCVM